MLGPSTIASIAYRNCISLYSIIAITINRLVWITKKIWDDIKYYIKHTIVDKDEAKTNFKCSPKMYWEMTHHDNKIKIICKEPNN